jgi:hypothetical protein
LEVRSGKEQKELRRLELRRGMTREVEKVSTMYFKELIEGRFEYGLEMWMK